MTEIRQAKLADLEPLLKAASDDDHVVIRPTHVAIRDGEFIGYLGVGSVPLVIYWADTKRSKARDSFGLVRFAEENLQTAGAPMFCALCPPQSPMYRYMKKLGYLPFGQMEVFIKKF